MLMREFNKIMIFSKKIAWKQQEKEKGREIKMNSDFSTKLD